MASIREVAKRAGVAACTVSRVLNDSASVTPKTREKIMKAMEELNYIPNELARSMFRQKAGIIAMLVPSIKHPFFSSLADSIEQYLYKKGYKLMLCSTSDQVNREEEYLRFFKSNIVDGVIMAVNNLEKDVYESFQKTLVMLDYYVNDKIPLIVSDHKMGGRLAAETFIKNGCKYVIHLCNEKENDGIISYEGHLELERILQKHGITCRKVEINWNAFDMIEYEKLAKTIFEYYPEVDGVMCADMAAVAFLNAGGALHKKIPEELCVIAFDGTYVVKFNEKKLTTIVQPLEEIALMVVNVMTEQIDGKGNKKINVRLPVTLEQGDTA
jgi:LacI family sucrose operon transcriptional repressor